MHNHAAADKLGCGSACGPVIVPVFKTGERRAILSLVGSTPTRFRQYFSIAYIATVLEVSSPGGTCRRIAEHRIIRIHTVDASVLPTPFRKPAKEPALREVERDGRPSGTPHRYPQPTRQIL
jgi:hypothetical protein